ncbi:unnamed protein product [Dibothriocephalus latus]|uniref:Uncharacterized protein n=1 Tax=Dibothriocephalus latus TaxID=60516 RepID=A0A3P7LQJ9_DIBLA|nr:unnamed protein product [Dibothriocephalus latus]
MPLFTFVGVDSPLPLDKITVDDLAPAIPVVGGPHDSELPAPAAPHNLRQIQSSLPNPRNLTSLRRVPQ